MTVLEAIQKGSDFLGRKGVESPRLHSELLLAQILALKRLHLYLEFGRALSEEESSRFRDFLQRRARREPLQHILGTTSFCGLELRVNGQVLVPRPETEVLAEAAWSFLQRRAAAGPEPVFLDFATGSGCVALAMLKHCPTARGLALDISPEALHVARENAATLGLSERLEFIQSDAFVQVPASFRADLLVANPPYIPTAEIDSLSPEVRDHDPRLALDGGDDGLAFYRLLAREAPGRLAADGRLMAEFGDGQDKAIVSLLEQAGWSVESVLPDLSGRPRVVIAAPGGG